MHRKFDLDNETFHDPPGDDAHDAELRTALRSLSASRERRRTRRYHLAAALIALVGAANVVFAGALLRNLATTGFADTPLPDKPPVADIWPDAVHVLPPHLADGRTLVPQVMVDDHRLIATDGAKHPEKLLIVDLRGPTVREFAALPHPELWTPYNFTVGAGHILWLSAGVNDRIWKLPIDGGRPKLVATLPQIRSGPEPFPSNPWTNGHLTIDGDMVYVSRPHVGRVPLPDLAELGLPVIVDPVRPEPTSLLRVPLRGGAVQPVPDTEGLQILVWPWLGELPSSDCAVGPVGGCLTADGQVRQDSDPVLYRVLRNLKTGERRTTSLRPPLGVAACTLSYCVAPSETGTEVGRRDGGRGRRVLDGEITPETGPITLDRFLVLEQSCRFVLHDLKTGRSVRTGAQPCPEGNPDPFVTAPDDRLLVWRTKQPRDGLVIVNLAAIP